MINFEFVSSFGAEISNKWRFDASTLVGWPAVDTRQPGGKNLLRHISFINNSSCIPFPNRRNIKFWPFITTKSMIRSIYLFKKEFQVRAGTVEWLNEGQNTARPEGVILDLEVVVTYI